MKKIIFFTLLSLIFGIGIQSQSYLFGIKSSDNTVDNILNIEKTYGLYFPLVGFIYDPRDAQDVSQEIKKIATLLGTQRIYHITLSPNLFTAQQVRDGAFDKEYRQFFETIKQYRLKVIFRTMHEMNGGRYPRSSNPQAFREAWIHVWNLSREVGLDQTDILFDFSVNHWDMITTDPVPSQKSPLIACPDLSQVKKKIKTLEKKKELSEQEKKELEDHQKEIKKAKRCIYFEDYYPGDEYVDIVGLSFYNRGKATSNRKWISPENILLDPERNTLQRLQQLKKPLFIDEVGTTAVWYQENYHYDTSREKFLSEVDKKNQRLKQLNTLLEKKYFLGAIYFNVDYTDGLTYPIIGEADRAIINLSNQTFYDSFWDLYLSSRKDFDELLKIFHLEMVEIVGRKFLIKSGLTDLVIQIDQLLDSKNFSSRERLSLYQTLEQQKGFPRSFLQAFGELRNIYYQALLQEKEL